jgi:MoxR-like ATPase
VLIAAPLVLAASRPPAQEADPLLTDAQRDRIRDRPVVRFTVSFEARPFLFL